MKLVESPLEGFQLERFEVGSDMGVGQSGAWCFFYGEVSRNDTGGWVALRARTGGEGGRCDETLSSKRWVLRGHPYVLLQVSVRRRPAKGQDERLEVSVSRRKLSGFSQEAAPVYSRVDEKFSLQAEETGLVIPLLIADERETDAFRVHDVILRVRALSHERGGPIHYGQISVHSDTPRADILLDGGIVGRTLPGEPTLLSNVVAGEREVKVRDLSRREARKLVTVPADRKVAVTLNLLETSLRTLDTGLASLGTNAQGQEEYWRPKDGAPVVKIPAGEFLMGSLEGEGEASEHPQRRILLSTYLIDKTEVTWGQYNRFLRASGTAPPEPPLWDPADDYPVTGVTWDEAAAFCEWVGGRLPTEAEWEKAARGTDGRRYSWGDEWDSDRCNTRDGGPHRPRGVGTFPGCVSPYGVLDMGGSVWEFCQDWYEERYYGTGPTKNPRGPVSGRLRVLRGGSWLEPSTSTRPASRQGRDPSWRNQRHGFRCAQDPRE
jgi:sulfatase modifying factor 1